MKNHELREKLELFLQSCNGDSLRRELDSEWLNRIIPNLDLLEKCDQGKVVHLEGNVAIHTGLVFDSLVALAPSCVDREADFVERLAVLLHDCRKPQTRVEYLDSAVSFPGHEHLAAQEVVRLAELLELQSLEQDRLYFMVAKHGDTHNWNDLNEKQRLELTSSPWVRSLALLHEADARSCSLKGGGHLPVFRNELMGLQ